MPTHYTTNNTIGASGSINSSTAVNSNNLVYSSNSVFLHTLSGEIGYLNGKAKLSQSHQLPAIIIDTYDENEKPVVMTFCPESNISANESMKMSMLFYALSKQNISHNLDFSVLQYVKHNQLERHFKFSS